MIEISNKSEFNNFIESEETVLVDFYSDDCMPCKMMKPALEELSREYKIATIDVMQCAEVGMDCGISAVPTLIFFKNSEEVKRMVGMQSKDAIKNQF